MARKIRVLVVDDSAFMRKMLTDVINSDPECEVIKTSKDGVEALTDVKEMKPDVITLDLELPEIDGLTCLAYIIEEFPTPVVVVTGFSEFLGEETIKALEYGAVGFVNKPGGPGAQDREDMEQELISQIKIASKVDMKKITPATDGRPEKTVKEIRLEAADKIVVIAASSGGPRALGRIIPRLPADLAAAVVVIQHIPFAFIPSFAERLNWESALDVKVARDQEHIHAGQVLVAPAEYYCEIAANTNNKSVIKLVTPRPKENFHFPLADRLMASLAPIHRGNAVGVVLTGMGNDGTEGLRAIKKYGGYTIAEDESTSMVFGMPKSAIDAGVVDKVLPLDEIADEIVRVVNG